MEIAIPYLDPPPWNGKFSIFYLFYLDGFPQSWIADPEWSAARGMSEPGRSVNLVRVTCQMSDMSYNQTEGNFPVLVLSNMLMTNILTVEYI